MFYNFPENMCCQRTDLQCCAFKLISQSDLPPSSNVMRMIRSTQKAVGNSTNSTSWKQLCFGAAIKIMKQLSQAKNHECKLLEN
jgi:hypothetical protein